MNISEDLRRRIILFQKNEITEHYIYRKLASRIKLPENRRVLDDIASDEFRHYQVWKSYTQQEIKPDKWKIWKYFWISIIFGLVFGVKLMEKGEESAQDSYKQLFEIIPEAETIFHDENQHESALLQLLDEEKLRYTGSIVLGLNDALVELTAALAGLTLALQNTKLIALTGSITGIAAALSMGTAEYLSTKTEGIIKNPFKASIYTSFAYIITVLLLVSPYLVFQNYYLCLGCTLLGALLIIGLFNYYISVVQDESFKKRFLEMAGLSMGVAAISFLIGLLIRNFLGIDI